MSEMNNDKREEEKNGETGKDQEAKTRNSEPASGDATAGNSDAAGTPDASPHPYEELLDEYPLRSPEEDPVWSVRIVKGWMWFLAFSIGGILLLLVLGLFYE